MAATMTPRLVERMLEALHGAEGEAGGGKAEPLTVSLRLESAEDLHSVAQALEAWGATTLGADAGRLSLDCRLRAERLWDLLGLEGVLEVAERGAGASSSPGSLSWLALASGVVAAGLLIGWFIVKGPLGAKTAEENYAAAAPLQARDAGPREGVVEAALSGDTLKLASGEVVRLAGLRAPASGGGERPDEIFGGEARATLAEMVEGKSVELAYPPRPVDSGGRLTAVVTLSGGADLGGALISRGAAELDVETAGPRQRASYGLLEAEAHRQRRGLWGGPVVGNLESKVYHLPGGQFYHRVSPANRVLFSSEEEARQAGYRSSSR